jgi:pimeloyl-ACP methyl ester carboxylesterase
MDPAQRRWDAAVVPLVCLGIVALYAMVVLVLFPQGDPSLAGRLVAAVVIAVVAFGAFAAVRWATPWVAGTTMLLVGFGMVAVLGGVVAKRAADGISVADVLGIAAGIAGIVLVVAGWRHALGNLSRGWLRVVIATLGTIVIAQFLLLPSILALDATNRVRPIGSERTPADLGLAYRDVRFAIQDGTRLAGWWIASHNGAAVIVLPGAGSTRDDVLDHAAFLVREGYGALLFDFRGHGRSEGRSMEFGWGAERDVRVAVSFALDQASIDRVGVLGLSMGGEVGLTSAAADPRIAVVVAEGVSARTWADARAEPDANPVAYANEWLMFALTEVLAPEPEPVPLVDVVRGIDAPVLLIAGSPANEATLGPIYADAAPESVTLWSIPEAPHIGGLSTQPSEYQERVLAFLEAALLGAD